MFFLGGGLLSRVLQMQKEHKQREERSSDESEMQTRGRNTSETVNRAMLISQLLFKVRQTEVAAKPLFASGHTSAKWDEFKKESDGLIGELQKASTYNFEMWRRDVLEALDGDGDEKIALDKNAKVMSFDRKEGGRLQVHYSERLVTLLKEARQLSALGCRIPKEVDEALSTAEKFYQNAMKLKQAATFYNTIGDQMLDCQQGMLVDEAVEFEQVINSQKKTQDGKHISWNNTTQLKEYTNTLHR
jgi:dynein heavy chain 2